MLSFRSLQKYLPLLGLPLFFLISHVLVQGLPVSPTVQDRASIIASTDVVLESIVKLTVGGIVNDENQFLRRIAYVETRDGFTQRESESGGIWAVCKNYFYKTQAKDVNSSIKTKIHTIKQKFSIDWTIVEWSELSKPLYSAIAAHLVLSLMPPTISAAVPPYNDVEGQAQFWKMYYNQNGSVDEFVHAVEKLEGSAFTSSGYDFYIGFPQNIFEANQKLLISSTNEKEPTQFTVQSTMSGFHFTGTAMRYSTTEVDLEDFIQVQNSSDRHKGIHVSSDSAAIVVHGLNYHRYTTDSFLALPCLSKRNRSRFEYFGMSYGEASGPNQVLLVACENNTTVTFENSSIVLNEMETYLKEDTADITGAKFVSDKPISFYSGHLCAYIPNNTPACDHIIEQLPPTMEWGREFLLASLYGRFSDDLYRIVNSMPFNMINICCSNPENLKSYKYQIKMNVSGEWEELVLPSGYFCTVQSKHPVLIAQFGLGHTTDYIGDPFMMLIPAIEQYSNHYTITALSEFPVNYITILVPSKHFEPASIYVDEDNLLGAKWDAVYSHNGDVCGYITYVSLDEGTHCVYHANLLSNIGVLVYGFDLYNSYGHPAGLQHIHGQSTVISFSQDIYTVSEAKRSTNITLLRSSVNTEDEKTAVMIGTRPSYSSATEGTDYISFNQMIVFENDESQKQVEIEILNDDNIEETEVIILYISGGDNIKLFPHRETEIRIIDNDIVTASDHHVDSEQHTVHVQGEVVIERGSQVSIHWSPTVFSNTTNLYVDITLCILLDQHDHLQCCPLATGVANSGHTIVTLSHPLLASHDSLKYPLLPIMFRVHVNTAHFHHSGNYYNNDLVSPTKAKPGNDMLHMVQQSPIRLLLNDNTVQRLVCEARFDTEPSSENGTLLINETLLLCPCIEQHADNDYKKQLFIYNLSLPHDSLQHFEDIESHEWMLDEIFNAFLTFTCYRSKANGSSHHQCCYDDGYLMINTKDTTHILPADSFNILDMMVFHDGCVVNQICSQTVTNQTTSR